MTQRRFRKLLGPILLFLLFAQAGFSQPTITVDDALFKGDKNARVSLVEFADYQCTFCARFYRETLPQIEENYIFTGKVKFFFRNFPLERSHPQAFKAAVAANCAGEQGKFWAMHHRLFTHQEELGSKDLLQHAKTLALDSSKFTRCLDSDESAAKVRKDLADGEKAAVKITPTFFLGLAEPNNTKITVQKTILGAKPFSDFKEAIDSLLGVQR
jgi:protein-disulfide isomerase